MKYWSFQDRSSNFCWNPLGHPVRPLHKQTDHHRSRHPLANTAPSSTGSHTTSEPSTDSTRSAASHAYGEPTSTKKRGVSATTSSVDQPLAQPPDRQPPHREPKCEQKREVAEVRERLDAQHDHVPHELHAVVERIQPRERLDRRRKRRDRKERPRRQEHRRQDPARHIREVV